MKQTAVAIVLIAVLVLALTFSAVDAKKTKKRATWTPNPARINVTPELYECMKQGGCSVPTRTIVTPEIYVCMKQGGC